jgi:hypothetical protein
LILVADKIERQLRKYKTRHFSKGGKEKDTLDEATDVSAEIDSDLLLSIEICSGRNPS